MNKKTVPVFFACDDNFVKYTIVAITSLKANANKKRNYDIHILSIKITDVMKKQALALADETFRITFDDVTDYMKSISYKMPVRDYYSKTTYYRLFIAEMFPHYDKAIYIDSDLIVQGDISELYDFDIGDNYIGACNEQVVLQVNLFAEYTEKAVGIAREDYFNAGMMLINCAKWREKKVLDQFIKLLHEFTFVVAQDEDYLNVLFNHQYKKLPNYWNCETFGQPPYPAEEAKIIHYIFTNKPWHYKDCTYADVFWKYAEQTAVIDLINKDLETYPEEKKEADKHFYEGFQKLTQPEIDRPDSYYKRQLKLKETRKNKAEPWKIPNGTPQSKSRLEVIERIKQYEKEGRWDKDAEIDIPAKPILPGTVDFKRTKLSSRIKAYLAFSSARNFIKLLKKQKQLVIKSIEGLENLESVKDGAIIACNHFNAFDSFAVEEIFSALKKTHKKSRLFRVITEANYTTYPGFYGKLMRNCNTLPLSTNHKVMNEFMHCTTELLQEGNFVVIYPEQSMWWNYRKPKPIKRGAFTIAIKAKVPVIPCFVTMKDTDVVDGDGFFVQEYTIHIGKPVYAPSGVNRIEASEEMMKETYSVWKEIYEETYGIPLSY